MHTSDFRFCQSIARTATSIPWGFSIYVDDDSVASLYFGWYAVVKRLSWLGLRWENAKLLAKNAPLSTRDTTRPPSSTLRSKANFDCKMCICYAGSFTVSRDHLTTASLDRNSAVQLLPCLRRHLPSRMAQRGCSILSGQLM